MSSDSIESLVAERVAQLDAITHRRNALLREMYHMIQQTHNAGALLELDEIESKNEDEEEGLRQFMDRFDLAKNPESGMVSNLLDSELFVSSPPIPSEEVAAEVEEVEEPAEPDVDSPMSEPPASPAHIRSPVPRVQKEEDEEVEINGVAETVEAEVAESESPMPPQSTPSLKRPREEEEEEEEKEEEEEEESPPDHLQAPVASSSRSPSRPVSASARRSSSFSQRRSRSRSQPLSSQSPKRMSIEPVPAMVQPIAEIVEVDDAEPMEDILEESPQPSSLPPVLQNAAAPVQNGDATIDAAAPPPISPPEEPPRPMVIHTAVDVQTIQPSLLIPTPTSPAPALPDFSFNDTEGEAVEEPPQTPAPAENKRHHFNPDYNLPPLRVLPPEYLRKGKSSKQKKKEKDKADSKGGKEEWAPLGFAKWGAVIRANPIHKKVSRATKCLSTKDWSVAITELRLMRTLDRVEALENVAKWSYRQPKKQRNLGGMTKTHWDYLLDEMKWMRVDFREERKWKYALAFNLSTAVLEWHEAQTREERIKLGICMHWKRPRATSPTSTTSQQQQRQQQSMDVDIDGVVEEQGDKENTFSDQESGDDDDDGEVEQRDIVDALETRNVLEEALEANGSGSGSGESADSSRMQSVFPDGVVRPKLEDVEDSSALGYAIGTEQRDGDAMEVDGEGVAEAERDKDGGGDAGGTQATKTEVDLVGLKTDSHDPVLGSLPDSESQNSTLPVTSSSKSAPKPSVYAPLRERIAYSDANKLFIDHDDLDLVKAMSDLTTEDSASLPPSFDLESTRALDLSDLFPDLQPLAMPEVASSGSESRKKSDKKSERDDNRRVDDSGYTKMAPMGKFMLCKPTVLGPLQPVRRWKNGKWLPPEEPAVTEAESSSAKITEEQLSELFDGVKPLSIGGSLVPHPPKDNKRRPEHAWSPPEDAALKSIVEKYPSNWTLVADVFNTARVTISIDKRTPWECFERWNLKIGGAGKLNGVPGHVDISPAGVDGTPSPTPSTSAQQAQMTTRGVKRLANISVTQGQTGATGPGISSDTMKRRRHTLMYETIRKTSKKREAAQKAATMNQRKPPNVHDTHGQYNKMPKLTPAELSRMKAEKEARDQQEMLLLRRRHEEVARQQQLLRAQGQASVAAGAAVQQPQPQQPQPQQPQQPQQQAQQAQPQPGQAAPGTPRPAPQSAQPVPQIRAQQIPQVNISQQQRIPTPMSAAAVAAARMSPQQILQVQAAQAQARANAITAVAHSQAHAHAHAQLQAQVQAQAQATPQAALVNLPAGAHLSPPYQSRAATSSPGVGVGQQASPPRTVGTPSNAGVAGSPRPPSAQAQLIPSPQVTVNAIPRPAGSIPAHYLPVVPPGAHFTQEQMDQAMRLSSLMQRTAMAQAQQGGQYPSQS